MIKMNNTVLSIYRVPINSNLEIGKTEHNLQKIHSPEGEIFDKISFPKFASIDSTAYMK